MNLAVDIAGIKMKNPVMTASGTFGYGSEYPEMSGYDINELGAIILKSVTLHPRSGNPPPRIVETAAGMLNSIGLQNIGVDELIKNELPRLQSFDTNIIVNIAGSTVKEYIEVTRILSQVKGTIAALEVNISCPNVKKGGMAFGTDPQVAAELIARIKEESNHLPIIVKLTPNVTDITIIAQAVYQAGADALSLINTLTGMAIDINTQRPLLATNIGGLSGPAIKPIALLKVHQVFQTFREQGIDIPIIGLGGIMSATDAIEFILAGAKAVAVGTANFYNPRVCHEIIQGMEDYLAKWGYQQIDQLVGGLKLI